MRTFYIFTIFLAILSTAAKADESPLSSGLIEPTGTVTLTDALNLALRANPELAVALREREAIEGIRVQSATRLNPSISTSVQDTRRENR